MVGCGQWSNRSTKTQDATGRVREPHGDERGAPHTPCPSRPTGGLLKTSASDGQSTLHAQSGLPTAG